MCEYRCDLCDADYVGYTCRHLFQRINEHKHSVIGKHLRDVHNLRNKDLRDQSTILKKCRRKLDCLIYEMLFIKDRKPSFNAQSDSIKANLFILQFKRATLVFFLFIVFIFRHQLQALSAPRGERWDRKCDQLAEWLCGECYTNSRVWRPSI